MHAEVFVYHIVLWRRSVLPLIPIIMDNHSLAYVPEWTTRLYDMCSFHLNHSMALLCTMNWIHLMAQHNIWELSTKKAWTMIGWAWCWVAMSLSLERKSVVGFEFKSMISTETQPRMSDWVLLKHTHSLYTCTTAAKLNNEAYVYEKTSHSL